MTNLVQRQSLRQFGRFVSAVRFAVMQYLLHDLDKTHIDGFFDRVVQRQSIAHMPFDGGVCCAPIQLDAGWQPNTTLRYSSTASTQTPIRTGSPDSNTVSNHNDSTLKKQSTSSCRKQLRQPLVNSNLTGTLNSVQALARKCCPFCCCRAACPTRENHTFHDFNGLDATAEKPKPLKTTVPCSSFSIEEAWYCCRARNAAVGALRIAFAAVYSFLVFALTCAAAFSCELFFRASVPSPLHGFSHTLLAVCFGRSIAGMFGFSDGFDLFFCLFLDRLAFRQLGFGFFFGFGLSSGISAFPCGCWISASAFQPPTKTYWAARQVWGGSGLWLRLVCSRRTCAFCAPSLRQNHPNRQIW